ncbi:MAG: hypothetical protein K2G55_03180 [Lachnospiraceae bacterium]|nr:hypothetical protein [Lachnospiraceae bacterium]MDE7204080.1 hypothetical protein [Lachnospiraceae bacterium]
MFVIDEDDQGNVIIKTTSSVGRTDQIMFLTIEDLLNNQELLREIAKWIKKMRQAPELQVSTFQDIVEEYMNCLNMLLNHVVEKIAEAAKSIKRLIEIQEIKKIQRETYVHKRKYNGRIEIRTQQQAKRTLKYKRYELRIYTNLFQRRLMIAIEN